MMPESKCSWKSSSSEFDGGMVFTSPDISSPSKAQQGQNIFLVTLGPAGLQDLRTAGFDCLVFQTFFGE